MRIIVVSPHRDDAAFSLGLSIDHWLHTGHRVHVLNCVTQSAFAPYSDAEGLHPNDRVSFVSALRKREDAAWNKVLGGRVQFTDLDMLDAPVRLACTVEEAFTAPIRPGDRALARIAGAIAKLVRNHRTEEMAFALPLAIGDHIDHRVAQRAALDTLQTGNVPVAFYEDLPYAAMQQFEGTLESHARETELHLEPVFAEPEPSDVDGRVMRKLRLVECYDSQIDSSAAKQIAEFCRRYSGRERIWANPVWRMSLATERSA